MKKFYLYILIGLVVIFCLSIFCFKCVKIFYKNNNSEDCVKSGGVLDAWGVCDITTFDFGKNCTSKEQCEGYCIAYDYNSTSGYCGSTKSLYGCWDILVNGKVKNICVE